jgi:hypothetical protein
MLAVSRIGASGWRTRAPPAEGAAPAAPPRLGKSGSSVAPRRLFQVALRGAVAQEVKNHSGARDDAGHGVTRSERDARSRRPAPTASRTVGPRAPTAPRPMPTASHSTASGFLKQFFREGAALDRGKPPEQFVEFPMAGAVSAVPA